MKRIVCLVLIAVLMASAAYAEVFSIRGIRFDMTVEEMLSAEKAQGNEPVSVTNKMTLGVAGTEEYDFSSYSSVYRVSGKFVSETMDGVYYFFDKSGLLCQIIYPLADSYRALSNVEDLETALASIYYDKYGLFLMDTVSDKIIFDAQQLMSLHKPDSFFKYYYSNAGYALQWLVPYDGNMYVDIVMQPVKQNLYKLDMVCYSMIVGYTRVTADEFERAGGTACDPYHSYVPQKPEDNDPAVLAFMDEI